MLLVVILTICCSIALAQVVELPYGKVEGIREESEGGQKYYAFRGIKYAEAGRFEDPKEPKPWEDTQKLTSRFAKACPHMKPLKPEEVTGDEDCLFLNVFTRSLETNAPVMAWIHGGSFTFGSSMAFGPDYLMEKNIVLVTLNYRLNFLGFMHLDDDRYSGNYGMKDQVEALKWIKTNIRKFGGNPDNVTLAGNSAGAAAVHWHMYSELSKGLFHRAICESGTARRAEVPRALAKSRTLSIATIFGCSYTDTEEIIKCLRKIPADKLVRKQKIFDLWRRFPFYYAVVVESKNANNPFVTVSPWSSDAKPHEVPLLMGYNLYDGAYIVPGSGVLKNQGEALAELSDYKNLFPVVMQYMFIMRLSTDAIEEDTEKIRKFYFGEKAINRDTFDEIKQMLTDSLFIFYIKKTLDNYGGTIYAYKYTHLNKHTYAEFEKDFLKPGISSQIAVYIISGWSKSLPILRNDTRYLSMMRKFLEGIFALWKNEGGPVHSDELLSLFKLPRLSDNPLTGKDLEVSKLMINLWVNFITKGDPNDTDVEPKWKPYKQNSEFYNINAEPKMEKFDRTDSYKFWNSLKWYGV